MHQLAHTSVFLQYLGSVAVNQPKGEEVVNDAIRRVKVILQRISPCILISRLTRHLQAIGGSNRPVKLAVFPSLIEIMEEGSDVRCTVPFILIPRFIS